MLPPSFQTTLLALEGKLRQLQTLERTVLQAAALEDENVAYCTASQLADACEQAVLLARALPACTGRPHVVLRHRPEIRSANAGGGWIHPVRAGSPCGMPMLLPRKSVAPPPMCGCSCCRLCAGSSRGSSRCGSPPACWCSATSMPGTVPTGFAGSRQHRDEYGRRLRGPLCDGG